MEVGMVRRGRSAKVHLPDVRRRVEHLFNSPLRAIAASLRDFLDLLDSQDLKENDCTEAVTYVSEILECLPRSFKGRFHFDAYMIQSITDTWSQGPIQCSRMIVPTYRKEWGHEFKLMPTVKGTPLLGQEIVVRLPVKGTPLARFDLIHIPRHERDKTAPLLDYPWLCHELGHYLLSHHGQTLVDLFLPCLGKLISTLKIRSIADQGIARTTANERMQDIETKWRLSKAGKSWSSEIAIDVIALWCCGPAYLDAFKYMHEDMRPFVIEQTHPPVEIRAAAVVQTACRLGWQNYVRPLEKMREEWNNLKVPASVRNRYASLHRKELVNGCIEAAIGYCEYMRIPRLQIEDVERIRQGVEHREILSAGIDVIVGAWLVYREQGGTAYEDWETRTVNALTDEAIQ